MALRVRLYDQLLDVSAHHYQYWIGTYSKLVGRSGMIVVVTGMLSIELLGGAVMARKP